MNVAVQDVPLDEDLISSIPSDQREWLRKLGVSGTLSGGGKIYTVVPENWRELYPRGTMPPPQKAIVDLSIGVRDGTVWPADGLFSVSQVTGLLHLHKDGIEILALHGKRDAGNISAERPYRFRRDTRAFVAFRCPGHDRRPRALRNASGGRPARVG